MSATADGTARFITRTSWLFILVGAYVSLTVPVDILIQALDLYVSDIRPSHSALARLREDAPYVFFAISGLCGLLMLAGGIGALRRRPWGRKLLRGVMVAEIVLALYALVECVAIMQADILPATDKNRGQAIGVGVLAMAWEVGLIGLLAWLFRRLAREEVKREFS